MDIADKRFLMVVGLLVVGLAAVVWFSGGGAAAMATKGAALTCS